MTLTLLRRWESVEEAFQAASMLSCIWPITETSGTIIRDISGRPNTDGTLSGSVTLNNIKAPDGQPAALFAGGYIEIPDFNIHSVDGNLGMTVGALVKFDSIPNTRRHIITKGGLSSAKYEWEFAGTGGGGTDGLFDFTIYGPGGANNSRQVSDAAQIGTAWVLLIGRVQSQAQSSKIDLYVNSSTPVASTNSTTAAGYTDDTSPVRIGHRADNAATAMNGYIRNAFVTPEALHGSTVERMVRACQREGWF